MTGTPLLEIDDLAIAYRTGDHDQRVVHGVSFKVMPGEVVALVGESGSGKTTTAQAALGLLAGNGRVERGAIKLNGSDITHWSQRRLDAVRGTVVSLIPQDPGSSLNPVRTVGAQIAEVFQLHKRGDRGTIRERVLKLLTRVGLTPAELRANQYPHELSGGMKQRVLIAIAVALNPALIVADEPTSALDVTVQRQVLDLIDELRRENGTAVLLVTHDLGVAADRADRLVVLQGGQIQEQGPVREVLAQPRSAYTRRLLSDAPSLSKAPRQRRAPSAEQDFAIEVDGLTHDFPVGGSDTFRALENVSFKVRRGTTHAIVGESGSGKTTLANLLARVTVPTEGRIVLDGEEISRATGIDLRSLRRQIQIVFQDPGSSLNPRHTVGEIVALPLKLGGLRGRRDRAERIAELLEAVHLPADFVHRYPVSLSGGQKQRVNIARALALEPRVLVLDEPTSALDVSVQARILALLMALKRERALTYVIVTHNFGVVRAIADRIAVMYFGKIVEVAPRRSRIGWLQVFANSPVTARALKRAISERRT